VTLSEADRQTLLALGQHLPIVWHAATTTPAERKRIVRLVVRDVILDSRRAPEQVWLQINWQTSATTEQWVPRRVTRYHEQARVESLRQRLQALKTEGWTDQAIAACLSADGYTTSHGERLTRGAVWSLRKRWRIASARQERQQGARRQWPDGSYTLVGVAEVIGVHIRTVHTWIARGMLGPRQAYKGGPLKITLCEEQIEALRDHVARERRPRRTQETGQAAHGAIPKGVAQG